MLATALESPILLPSKNDTAKSQPMPLLQLAPPAPTSPFSKLAAMFENGAMPDPQSLVGWRAGKLFRAGNPEDSISVLLAANWRQPSSASGSQVLALTRMENESPRFFDDLDTHKRQEIKTGIEQNKILPRTYVGQNCLYVANANGETGDKMFIRQIGGYFVFKGYASGSRELYYGYVTSEPK